MRKLLKNHKGLTMVEVLVTVALLAIVIVPCLSSFVVAQRGNVLAKQTFDEYTAAANLMEELKGEVVSCTTAEEAIAEMKDIAEGYDGIYVHYKGNVNHYVEVWIYKGDGEYEEYSSENADDSALILKGVIAP